VLLTDCFLRSALYVTILKFLFGNEWVLLRTAVCAVFFKLCSLYLYLKWMGAPYVLLLSQCSWGYVPYACISNEWVLLTYCFLRSGPYVMFLIFVFQISGCSWRTAFCAVHLTLCFLGFYFKWVGALYALLFCAVLFTLCSLCFFKWEGAPYVLLSALWSLRYVPYIRIANKWVLLTDCFLRSAPYIMFLMFLFQMNGCSLSMFLVLVFEMSRCF
jgi:hypothetical protein